MSRFGPGRPGRVVSRNMTAGIGYCAAAVAERITGWTQQAACGQSLWTVFDRADRSAEMLTRTPVEVMQAHGVTVDRVHRVVAISRDGHPTALQVRANLTRAADDDGTVRGLAMVFRDMTPLNRVEAVRARRAAIVASSNGAIIGKTLDGRITRWNQAAKDLLGDSPEQAIGQPVQVLIPAERKTEALRILADLAMGRTAVRHRAPGARRHTPGGIGHGLADSRRRGPHRGCVQDRARRVGAAPLGRRAAPDAARARHPGVHLDQHGAD